MKVPMRYCDRNTLKFTKDHPTFSFSKLYNGSVWCHIWSASSSTTFQKDKLPITSHGVFQYPQAHHEGWMDGWMMGGWWVDREHFSIGFQLPS